MELSLGWDRMAPRKCICRIWLDINDLIDQNLLPPVAAFQVIASSLASQHTLSHHNPTKNARNPPFPPSIEPPTCLQKSQRSSVTSSPTSSTITGSRHSWSGTLTGSSATTSPLPSVSPARDSSRLPSFLIKTTTSSAPTAQSPSTAGSRKTTLCTSTERGPPSATSFSADRQCAT